MRTARLVLIALMATFLAMPAPSAAVPPAESATPIVRLSVMSLNMFYGGDDYDLSTGDWCPVANDCPAGLYRMAKIINASGADVVGLQEPERNTRKLAEVLGWYASPQAHVISRYPVLDPPRKDGLFTFVMPRPGLVVAVANVHLPSTPYGPYQVRKGWPRKKVLELERSLRLPALHRVLRELPDLARRGVPVFLTGDFNSPSHLDWTPEVAAVRPEVKYAVQWPASKALADAGFRDSYRDVRPDPVQDPGFTWSPGGPETQDHDFFDRIDWVLHTSGTTVSSRLVGERGNPQVDLAFANPFPTDHRGVVSAFDVALAEAPVIVSPEHRRVVIGSEPLRVRYHGTASRRHDVVALVRPRTTRLLTPRRVDFARNGVVSLDTSRLRPGRYDVVLADSLTGQIRARAPIWVYRAGFHPWLRTDKASYGVGDSVRVRFAGAPGQLFDWVGLFRCFKVCRGAGWYLAYRYTHTHIEGSVRFGAETWLGEGTVPWPLKPGQYIARLFVDDSYHAIGKSNRFTIR